MRKSCFTKGSERFGCHSFAAIHKGSFSQNSPVKSLRTIDFL
ncbi:hypothetical protein [Phormidesmis priestleyi]